MNGGIDSIEALEACIGRTPPPVHLKVIDHLDAHARRWIGAAPLAFLAFADGRSAAVTLAGGPAGFAAAEAGTLRLPAAALDDPGLVRPGLGFGSLFLAPGIGETLRVNGRVAAAEGGTVTVAVEECYVHCAKALIRSDFWSAAPLDRVPEAAADFVAGCRFAALATADRDGRADLSPKGDPAGAMVRLDGGRAWFADRPGNRRADSLRNIIAQPQVAMALLTPGSTEVAVLSGPARLTADAAAREAFAVRGKVPHLAVAVEGGTVTRHDSAALRRAGLWPVGAAAEGIDPPRAFTDHVRLNRHKGLQARLAGAVLSIPGLMRKGLEKDYESNLY